jgi:hypothetical protein
MLRLLRYVLPMYCALRSRIQGEIAVINGPILVNDLEFWTLEVQHSTNFHF